MTIVKSAAILKDRIALLKERLKSGPDWKAKEELQALEVAFQCMKVMHTYGYVAVTSAYGPVLKGQRYGYRGRKVAT